MKFYESFPESDRKKMAASIRRMTSTWGPAPETDVTDSRRTWLGFGECKKWTHHHLSAFCITFFGYALFHATRKTFSNVKATIESEWTPLDGYNSSVPGLYNYEQWNSRHLFTNTDNAALFLGTLDTLFMTTYAVGLFVSGILGDRFDLRIVLTSGMFLSAFGAFLFGTLSEWQHIYNVYYYSAFWLLSGFLQASGWPTVVAVIGNWFGKSSRGFVMGLWGACASVGNIIGAYTAAAVINNGYEYCFLLPSAMLLGMGVIVFFGLLSSPAEVGLPPTDGVDSHDGEIEPLLREDVNGSSVATDVDIARPKAIGFFQACLLPGVLPYSIAYACLKLVNYSFFFWLPYYLKHVYGWSESESDELSVWYDIGGIIGSILGGALSDWWGCRSPVVGVMLILSPPSLFIYHASPADKVVNAGLMLLIGVFIGGTANLISTAIAADLGRTKELQGRSEALSTVTGIVDGTGSFGVAIGQVLIPVIQTNLGWDYVFYLFIVMCILTLVCILKIIYHDTVALWRRCRCRKEPEDMSVDSQDIESSLSYEKS